MVGLEAVHLFKKAFQLNNIIMKKLNVYNDVRIFHSTEMINNYQV